MSFYWFMKRVHWYACPKCGTEYRSQHMAVACRQAHAIYAGRPSPTFHTLGEGQQQHEEKIETFCTADQKRFCLDCAPKSKDETYAVMLADPGSCHRCKRPIVAKPVVYQQQAPLVGRSERRHQERLDTTPRYKKESFRRQLFEKLHTAGAHSLMGDPSGTVPPARTEEGKAYEERLRREFGNFRNDPTRGNPRFAGTGYIEIDPEAEPIEADVR